VDLSSVALTQPVALKSRSAELQRYLQPDNVARGNETHGDIKAGLHFGGRWLQESKGIAVLRIRAAGVGYR
jgi:hypothetical protein